MHISSGRPLVAAAIGLLAVITQSGAAGAVPADHDIPSVSAVGSPSVSPAPQHMVTVGEETVLGSRVRLVVSGATDTAASDLLTAVLRDHGVRRIGHVDPDAPSHDGGDITTIHLGPADRPDVADALGDVEIPDTPEGYALRVDGGGDRRRGTVALGGVDRAGQYYAVQTFRQLLTGDRYAVAPGVQISDFPSMPLRGTIEGFYGSSWTHDERLDQLAFYGDVKANTYVYAPKDDPYHRDRWREPYPADELAELAELVETARRHHVEFTFALSPGTSICYSSRDDRDALLAKLDTMFDIGVRTFSIPLDDISYTRWNCAEDEQVFGPAGRAAAANAQVELLNNIQRGFVEARDGVRPLQMVPTEYGDLNDTEYKQVFRAGLDPDVVVMWTGTDVVPPRITVAEAETASALFGRDVFVWDNYPVNDFAQTAGRLLLAPYDHREPGLSDHLSGIVSNPMNQAAASKVAVFTMADFSWNDRAYDRDQSWSAAADYLTGGTGSPSSGKIARALLVFFDLNHRAPTFGSDSWQPQAPDLARRIDRFWEAHDAGDPAALHRLRRALDRIAEAPDTIRSGVPDAAFLSDTENWLLATELWGGALQQAARVLAAIETDRPRAAAAARTEMERLIAAAGGVRSVPGENRYEGVVQIGDGVIDAFTTEVAARHDEYLGLPRLRNVSEGREATQISDWSDDYPAANAVDGDLWNFSTTSGAEPQPWWQVDLGRDVPIERIDIYNRTDCCGERVRDYYVLIAEAPFTGSLADALADPEVVAHHEAEQAGHPTGIVFTSEPGASQVSGRYVRLWSATDQPQELNMAEVQVFGR